MSSPIDWPTIESSLRDVVVDAVAQLGLGSERVFWSDQDHPIGERPFVVLRTSGSIPLGPPGTSARDRVQIVDVQIVTALAQPYTVEAAGVLSTYVAGGADTPTTIRDGLVAAINADQAAATGGPFAAAAPETADTLRITATDAGVDLFVAVTPDPDVTRSIVFECLEVLTIEIVEFSLGVQSYACYDDAAPSRAQHAKVIAECVRAAFTTQANRLRMRCDAGLGYMRREGVLDLSTLEGSQHETRASVDLFFSVRSVTIEQTGGVAKVATPGTTTPPPY